MMNNCLGDFDCEEFQAWFEEVESSKFPVYGPPYKMHGLNYFIVRKGTVMTHFQVEQLNSVHPILWNILETAQLKLFFLFQMLHSKPC